MNLKQAIEQGANNPDPDTALSSLLQVLGVTTGDVAAQVFSSVEDGDPLNTDYWPHASPEERKKAINYYIKAELMYMSESHESHETPIVEEFDPYTDPETKAMLERAGIATHKYRR